MGYDELYERTKEFALRVMAVVDVLPRTTSGRAVGDQLVRSGTSVGANYRAARRGRSKAEFIAKLGISCEEADESAYWLELIIAGNLLKPDRIKPLLQEARELTAIFTSSIKSAKKNSPPSSRRESATIPSTPTPHT